MVSEKLTPSPTQPLSFPRVNWCNCNQTPENGAPEGSLGWEHWDSSLLSLIHNTCASNQSKEEIKVRLRAESFPSQAHTARKSSSYPAVPRKCCHGHSEVRWEGLEEPTEVVPQINTCTCIAAPGKTSASQASSQEVGQGFGTGEALLPQQEESPLIPRDPR